jgi:hypothetical protein
MSFLNVVHSAGGGDFLMVNQSFVSWDMKCLSIFAVEYKSKAIMKPSLALDPCCACQKEFSKHRRIAGHVAVKNINQIGKRGSAKPAKAAKEGVCIKLLLMI